MCVHIMGHSGTRREFIRVKQKYESLFIHENIKREKQLSCVIFDVLKNDVAADAESYVTHTCPA